MQLQTYKSLIEGSMRYPFYTDGEGQWQFVNSNEGVGCKQLTGTMLRFGASVPFANPVWVSFSHRAGVISTISASRALASICPSISARTSPPRCSAGFFWQAQERNTTSLTVPSMTVIIRPPNVTHAGLLLHNVHIAWQALHDVCKLRCLLVNFCNVCSYNKQQLGSLVLT